MLGTNALLCKNFSYVSMDHTKMFMLTQCEGLPGQSANI